MKPTLNRMQCTIHNVEYDEHYSPKTNTATSCPVCMNELFHKAYDRAEAAEKHVELLLSVIDLKSTQILCHNAEQWRDADLMAEFNHTRPTASPSATLLWLLIPNNQPTPTK